MELEQGTLLIERRDPAQGGVLRAWLESYVPPAFAGRVLPIDVAVAQCCAGPHAPTRELTEMPSSPRLRSCMA